MLLCGTCISGSDVPVKVDFSIKKGVRLGILGIWTFFEVADMVRVLEIWGVDSTKTPYDVLEELVGRPRHLAYLASSILQIDGSFKHDAYLSKRNVFVKLYQTAFEKIQASNTDIVKGSFKKGTGLSISLYEELKFRSYYYMLERNPSITCSQNAAKALELGNCALRKIPGDSPSSPHVDFVLAEPLAVEALSGSAKEDFERIVSLGKNHSYAGGIFGDFLALCGEELCKCMNSICEEVGSASFKKEWTFKQRQVFQVAKMCSSAEELNTELLRRFSEEKSLVLFPSVFMGPDLILVLWCGNQSLVVLVQAKSGVSTTSETAFLSFLHQYTRNRKSLS